MTATINGQKIVAAGVVLCRPRGEIAVTEGGWTFRYRFEASPPVDPMSMNIALQEATIVLPETYAHGPSIINAGESDGVRTIQLLTEARPVNGGLVAITYTAHFITAAALRT